jgi:hypothetical protein
MTSIAARLPSDSPWSTRSTHQPQGWTGAVTVLLDVAAARRCADRALLRRDGVVLIVRSSR